MDYRLKNPVLKGLGLAIALAGSVASFTSTKVKNGPSKTSKLSPTAIRNSS
jgi:predicted ribosomally synthesized peptide with SipW-like signal peptide